MEPTREEIDKAPGAVLLEFGTRWCPYCQSLDAVLPSLLAKHPSVKHLWVEDGRGRPLGRSFKVKLWPNLVFLQDGRVLEQLARPQASDVEAALARHFGQS